jgi:hypothetical protein
MVAVDVVLAVQEKVVTVGLDFQMGLSRWFHMIYALRMPTREGRNITIARY